MIRKITIGLILFTIAALIGWDIYAFISVPDGEGTISDVILDGAKSVPAISFAGGFLCGHLFWPQRIK